MHGAEPDAFTLQLTAVPQCSPMFILSEPKYVYTKLVSVKRKADAVCHAKQQQPVSLALHSSAVTGLSAHTTNVCPNYASQQGKQGRCTCFLG